MPEINDSRNGKIRKLGNQVKKQIDFLKLKGGPKLRDHSIITSPFAGGELGFWQGAAKEQSQSSVTEEQRNQKPNSPQSEGAGRGHDACGVTRRLNPHEGIRPPRALHPTRRRSRQMVNLFLSDPLEASYSLGGWNGRGLIGLDKFQKNPRPFLALIHFIRGHYTLKVLLTHLKKTPKGWFRLHPVDS